jgi:hypothetical protein
MGGTCSAHGEYEMPTECCLKNLKERGHLKDLDINGNNTKVNVRVTGWEGLDRIHLAHYFL